MFEGIETGYEDKFDFPARDALPQRSYLLASLPRSGSTFFSHLLWRSGCLGAPLEYLNFEPAGPYGGASDSVGDQIELWRKALNRRTSPNGVFGLKAFPLQLEAVQRQNPRLMAEAMRLLVGQGAASKVIELRRRDRTAHAISYARALLSGIWRKEQEEAGRTEPEYSEAALEHAHRLLEQQDAAWRAMYRDIGIVPLIVWYEDALADPAHCLARVAEHLGVSIDPGAEVTVPIVERQSQAGAQAWAEAHSKV